jgi:hypothetical protein
MKISTAKFGGSFSDSEYLGDPSNIKDRQWAGTGTIEKSFDAGNIAGPMAGPTADIYMVPDFQGQSGQGANQSTMRPIGSA